MGSVFGYLDYVLLFHARYKEFSELKEEAGSNEREFFTAKAQRREKIANFMYYLLGLKPIKQ
jgi:hypothetical protein